MTTKKQRLGDRTVHVHGEKETVVFGPGDELPKDVADGLPQRSLARDEESLVVRGAETQPEYPEPSEDGPAIAEPPTSGAPGTSGVPS